MSDPISVTAHGDSRMLAQKKAERKFETKIESGICVLPALPRQHAAAAGIDEE